MKKTRNILLMMLAALLTLAMTACGGKTETGEMSGKLTDASQDSIVVESGGEETKFITDDSTVYYLGAYDHLTLNDEIDVQFHKKGSKSYADIVTIEKHEEETLTFSGTVTDLHEGSITVTSDTLTVDFAKDNDTAVDGDLSDGDEVDVVYTGDLSKYPEAKSIKVTKEKETPKETTVSGIVTDFTSNSIAISIDSAHTYRFSFDSKTKVSGLDKYVKIGDSVTITFSGDPDDSPAAAEIKITKKADEVKKTLNGTIKSVGNDQIVVDTGKSAYIIKTDKNTRFTGEKPAKGYKTKVTYYGKLGSKATASIVYCVKSETTKVTKYKVVFTDGMGKTLKTQQVEKGKAATAPSKPTRSGYTFGGWDKDFKKVTSDLTVNAKWTKNTDPKPEPTPTPDPEPEPSPEEAVVTEGTITHWTTDDSDSFGLKPADGDEITLAVGEFTDIPAGYLAEAGDVVKATYLKSDMKATKIELVQKAEKEDENATEAAKKEERASGYENQAEQETASEPEQQDDQESAVSSEQADEPEQSEEADEDQDEEPAEVLVEAKASIIEGDENKMTAKMKLANGETVTLKLDKNTTIASGYFPQKDDEVKITYEKNGMTLRNIQLINRPVQDVPAEGEEG